MGTTRDVLNLGQGAAGQTSLISQYSNVLKKFKHKPLDHPVIILCDNDSGPSGVFKKVKEKTGAVVSKATNAPFYHCGENLYVVKVPEGTPASDREMEDLFDPALLKTLVDGKPFDRKKEHGDSSAYGKVVFAEKVVRPAWSTIDFSGFVELLERINQCIVHYATVKATALPAAASGVGEP